MRPDVFRQIVPAGRAIDAEATSPNLFDRAISQPMLKNGVKRSLMMRTVVRLQSIQSSVLPIAGRVRASQFKFRLVDVSAVPSPFIATVELLVAFQAWEWRITFILNNRDNWTTDQRREDDSDFSMDSWEICCAFVKSNVKLGVSKG